MRPNTLCVVAYAAVLVGTISVRAASPAPQGRGGGRGAAVTLPDGPGKASVEAYCSRCHSLGLIANSGGYTRDGWQQLLSTMIAAPPEQAGVLADYLAAHFPEQPRPKPVVLPGSVKVSFKEWSVPTLGSRPHDPLSAPDGSLWYTGQFANKLGRVDVRTGDIKEFSIPIEQSGPHGLTADKAGHIWFTANSKGYIGKLDPKTGTFEEYKLPEAARDPHTPLFDQKGTLWFTAQGANIIGRIDPGTREVKVVQSLTERSNPYGLVVSSTGVPFVVLFGTNKIASVDPATMAIKEYVLPNADTRPRRIAITPDDVLWYADYSRGYLGRFDPKTGNASEWPSPSGPRSQPYGIAAIGDAVWYCETGIRPNTLVRFDTKTEKFQTWLIPGGGGVVRNMMATEDGKLVIAESGVNKVGLIEIGN
jgi:virginiamycin B lyase